MSVTIEIRGDTAANWSAANPVLADRELGFEKETSKLKIGDGATAWNDLGYLIANDARGVSVLEFAPGGSVDGSYGLIGAGRARVGDGSGTTLAGVFATLADAQVVYPFASDLTHTVDWCAIQAALNHLYGSNLVGLTVAVNSYPAAGGGELRLPCGTFVCSHTLIQPGDTTIVGAGLGGSMFSDWDANMPWSGTVIKLADNANCDLLQSVNFPLIDGMDPVPTYQAAVRIGFRNLVLDGNNKSNTSGRCVAYYVNAFVADHFTIQRAAGDGFYCNGDHQAGYEHEALLSNFRIQDNGGHGLNMQGPHDSQIAMGFCAGNGGSGIVEGPYLSILNAVNVHNWANGAYNFDMQSMYANHVNCISDGVGLAGIRVAQKHVNWRGGTIMGTNAPGEVLVQVGNGDGSALTVRGCVFDTQWELIGPGTVPLMYADDGGMWLSRNQWGGPMIAAGNVRFVAYGSLVANAAQSATSPTLTFTASSMLGRIPSSGGIWVGDASSATMYKISYTGMTNSGGVVTLTGCTGGSSGKTITSGQRVLQCDTQSLAAPGIGGETWLLDPVDGLNSGALQIASKGSSATVYDARVVQHNGAHTFNVPMLVKVTAYSTAAVDGGGNVTFDASIGNFQQVFLTGNCSGSAIVNPTAGQIMTIQWHQDGTGSRAYVWPTSCRFAGNAAPVPSTGSNRSDAVTFRYNGAAWQEIGRAINVPRT